MTISYKIDKDKTDLFTFGGLSTLLQIKRNGAVLESYTYDADGNRVKKTVGTSTNFYYPFATYEISGTTAIKYYFFAGQRVAMKSGSTLTYLHGDHLGSTALATTSGGAWQSQEKYFAYGKDRDSANNVPTDNRFTGQKSDGSGLMYYQSRYYDPQTGLFVSPDTIVPDAGNVFAYNRSMYVLGRVMNANDPSGHAANDKAITAGDGAGTTRIGFFSDDRFLCSQGTCVSNESALAQDTAALLLIKEMTSNSKNVAMLMAMVGGVEVEPVLESGPVFEVSPNTGSTNSAASRIGIRGAKPGEGSAGGPTAGKSITKAMRLSDLEANKNANPSGNYQCTNCGYENTDPSHFDIDHIVAKSQNGNTEPVNRRVLCRGCNRSAQEGWPPLPGSDWASKHPD